jgi:hypothetical protein
MRFNWYGVLNWTQYEHLVIVVAAAAFGTLWRSESIWS